MGKVRRRRAERRKELFSAREHAPHQGPFHAILHPHLLADQERLRRARTLLALGLGSGVLLSIPLWRTPRAFPLLPRLSFVPALPAPFDAVVLIVVLALVLMTAARSRPRREILALAVVTALLVLMDDTRLQPWVYQYVVMLLVASPWSDGEPIEARAAQLDALRVMMASVYFWSGLQKINVVFFGNDGPWFMEPITRHLPAWAQAPLETSAYALPAVEVFVAIGLLVPRLRRAALLMGFGTHLFVLYALGPLGHDVNSVVWPWSVAMIGLLWVLFAGAGRPVFRAIWSRPVLRFSGPLAVLVFAFLPALNFAGLWDSRLSWSLYSGIKPEAYVYIADAALACVPSEVRQHLDVDDDGNTVLNVWDWAMDVVKVPPPADPWAFRRLLDQLCACDRDGGLISVMIWEPARWAAATKERHRCHEVW